MSAQERVVDPLHEPFETTLLTVDEDRLLVNRLVNPLVASANASQSGACISAAARGLFDVLCEVHRRGFDDWARKGYADFNNRYGQRVARVLVEAAAAGNAVPVTDYVRGLISNGRALGELLDNVAVVFTYSPALRPSMLTTWRHVLETALHELDEGRDFFGDHHWADRAVSGLLPAPEIDMGDSHIDATLRDARASWIDPDAIEDLVQRWLIYAAGEPKAADALVQLARTKPVEWQATKGLAWIERLIGGSFGRFANRCWFLVEWLQELRASVQLEGGDLMRWRRVVDGLASADDDRAARLQQTEE